MIEKSLKSAFIETFEEAMKNNGFLRKGKIFHRIVNGKIVQLLSFHKYSGPEFTIQFLIDPLCSGYEHSTYMEASRMDTVFRDIDPWRYEYQTDEYIEYMPEALRVTEERLLPLFDSITDYESYLEIMNSLYSRPMPIFSSLVYMINLTLGNYEKSKESREAFINFNIEANQKSWGTDHHINPETQEIFEQKCKEYYRVKEAMDRNDHEYIGVSVIEGVGENIGIPLCVIG